MFQRDFLGGKGKIDLSTGAVGGPQLNITKPIPEGADSIYLVAVGAKAEAQLGKAGSVSVDLSFQANVENGIKVLRPGEPSDFLDSRGLDELLDDDELGVLLFFDARAGVNVAGILPAGPTTFNFGVEAGGGVGYERFLVFDKDAELGVIVRSVLAKARLPQHTGTVARVPEPGEVLVFRYNGFLNLTAGLNWGYQLNGVEDFEFRDLEAAIEYDIRLKAGVEVGYSLAGDFEIEARQGHDPNFVRLIVRKSRDRQFSFAAGFHADASYELTGLPDSADEWLTTFFGADAKTALKTFDEVRDLSDLTELEKRVGKLLMPSVRELSQKWLGKALDNDTVTEFVQRLNQVVATYQSADQIVVGKITDLYEDYLGQGNLDELRSSLLTIRDLNGRQALRQLPGDDKAWKIVDRLVGGDLFKLLESNRTFSEVREVAARGVDFLDGNWQEDLRDLIDELKSALKLDDLFGHLERIDSKQELEELADERLQGLVERILGKSFAEIKDGPVAKHAKELRKTLDKIDGFKDKIGQKIKEAYAQSVSLSINYAYSRSSSRKALIDMEFDVSTREGRDLFRAASTGQFKELFAKANLRFMRVHEGQLTHTLTKSSVLQINTYGWNMKRLVEVVSDTQHSLEAGDGGLVQIFASGAAIKRRTEKGGEILETNFLLQMLGENLRGEQALTPEARAKRGFLIKTLEKMTIRYDLMQIDDATDTRELTQYLRLAEMLGLIPNAQAVAQQLTEEFAGAGGKTSLGRVQTKYVVKYAPSSIQAMFKRFSDTEEDRTLSAIVRATCRQVLSTRYVYMRRKDWNSRVGFGYLNPKNAALHDKGSAAFLAGKPQAILPGWFTGKKSDRAETLPDPQKKLVNVLFNIEKSLARNMVKLDNIVDDALAGRTSVSDAELEEAALNFVKKGANVDSFGPANAFFGIVDRLISEAEGRKGQRESALILDITPEGSEETIRKVFMAGSPEDSGAAAQSPAAAQAAAAGEVS